nr:phage major tail protein 2 [uncultured Mediterranean phage uvMED]
MPVACNSSTLTGSSGAVYFVPAGTKACLLAADFADAGVITVNSQNDFRVGDPITLTPTGGAVLDTAYANAAVVTAVDAAANTITVTEADGTAIGTLTGDGEDNGGHIELRFSPAQGICEVREWSVDYSREQLDVTTLPCKVGATAGAAKWAATKKFQGGYAEITGTMTLYISANERSLANRLMESVHLNNQDGAEVKLYMDAVSDGATDPQPDDAASTLIAGEVSFTDFSTSVNPDDPTQAEVSFSMCNVTHWIGQAI